MKDKTLSSQKVPEKDRIPTSQDKPIGASGQFKDKVAIRSTQVLRILVCGSERFAEGKKSICDYLVNAGHEGIEACAFHSAYGKGLNGDRAIENLLSPCTGREELPDPVDVMVIVTDDSGYCGVITTIRVGIACAHQIPVYSIGQLQDEDYLNYVVPTSQQELLSLVEKPM